jgi:hypothetical protein
LENSAQHQPGLFTHAKSDVTDFFRILCRPTIWISLALALFIPALAVGLLLLVGFGEPANKSNAPKLGDLLKATTPLFIAGILAIMWTRAAVALYFGHRGFFTAAKPETPRRGLRSNEMRPVQLYLFGFGFTALLSVYFPFWLQMWLSVGFLTALLVLDYNGLKSGPAAGEIRDDLLTNFQKCCRNLVYRVDLIILIPILVTVATLTFIEFGLPILDGNHSKLNSPFWKLTETKAVLGTLDVFQQDRRVFISSFIGIHGLITAILLVFHLVEWERREFFSNQKPPTT